jgi:large subunit ribosomal protein L7/L12
MGGPVAAAPVADEDKPKEEEKPKEKTIFSLKLEKIDTAQKAKVIKEVKALKSDMNLMQVSHYLSYGVR